MAKETASQKKARQKAEEKARAAKNAAKKSGGDSSSSKDSKGSSSKEKKSAINNTEKYYAEKKADTEKLAAEKTARLAEDLAKVMDDAGIARNRATEDYLANIKNINDNKAADVATINDYVSTNTTRTTEDLATSLAKEARRFSLESDQVNKSLADNGMTFSERTPEKIAQAGNAVNTGDINMDATRSFQDIARYETSKNLAISLKYGQQEADATTTKTRSIEDILNAEADAKLRISRGTEDVAFGKAVDIRDNTYNANDAVSSINNAYTVQDSQLADKNMTINVTTGK